MRSHDSSPLSCHMSCFVVGAVPTKRITDSTVLEFLCTNQFKSSAEVVGTFEARELLSRAFESNVYKIVTLLEWKNQIRINSYLTDFYPGYNILNCRSPTHVSILDINTFLVQIFFNLVYTRAAKQASKISY